MKKVLLPKGMAKPRGNYSHGVLVKSGDLLFIAGQIPIGPDGTIVGIGDPYLQAKQVFENMAAVLSEVGADFKDIVKVTIYITDISYKGKVNKAREEYFHEDFPASTLVVVKGLADVDFLVEVEAIAWIEKF